MSDAQERARKRRAQWTGGVAAGFGELGAIDAEQWLNVPGSDKLEMVFDTWAEQAKGAADEAPARIQRSVGGVRKRAAGTDVLELEQLRDRAKR